MCTSSTRDDIDFCGNQILANSAENVRPRRCAKSHGKKKDEFTNLREGAYFLLFPSEMVRFCINNARALKYVNWSRGRGINFDINFGINCGINFAVSDSHRDTNKLPYLII